VSRAAATLVLALAGAACAPLPIGPHAPPGPDLIPQALAIGLATTGHPTAQVLEATFDATTPEPPGGRGTWTVIMRLDERRPCGPAPLVPGGPVTTCHITSRTVVLDARDGTFVRSEESGSTESG
jgi:hypothetical protein